MSTNGTSKVAAALAKAKAEFAAVHKGGFNKQQGYPYPRHSDFVDAVERSLTKHGLFVVATIVGVEHLPDQQTQRGGLWHRIQVKMENRLYHESGESLPPCVSEGEGQDPGDKAIYKATTGARKYGLALLLNLATDDDAEADERIDQREHAAPAPVHNRIPANGTPKPAPSQPPRPPDSPQYTEFVKYLNQCVAASPISFAEGTKTAWKVCGMLARAKGLDPATLRTSTDEPLFQAMRQSLTPTKEFADAMAAPAQDEVTFG